MGYGVIAYCIISAFLIGYLSDTNWWLVPALPQVIYLGFVIGCNRDTVKEDGEQCPIPGKEVKDGTAAQQHG